MSLQFRNIFHKKQTELMRQSKHPRLFTQLKTLVGVLQKWLQLKWALITFAAPQFQPRRHINDAQATKASTSN